MADKRYSKRFGAVTLEEYAVYSMTSFPTLAVNGDVLEADWKSMPLRKDLAAAAVAISDLETDEPDDAADFWDDDDSDAYSDAEHFDYGHVENDHGIESRQQNKEFLKRLGNS